MQWNDFASYQGIRFGLISNHMWTWALCADSGNNILVSPAYRYNAMNPTVLEASPELFLAYYM